MGGPPVSQTSVQALLHDIAEGGPAPACGSAAAVAAGLAAALAGKVARRSGGDIADAEALVQTLDDLRAEALVLADSDARAVTAMIASRTGVPTEAIAVPKAIRELADKVRRLSDRLVAEGNQALIADAVSAGELAKAAAATVDSILRSNAGS